MVTLCMVYAGQAMKNDIATLLYVDLSGNVSVSRMTSTFSWCPLSTILRVWDVLGWRQIRLRARSVIAQD